MMAVVTAKKQPKQPKVKKQDLPSAFASFLGDTFFGATVLTIATMFLYRLWWIISVFGVFGLRFDNEAFTNYGLGPFNLRTGDPGLFLILFVFALFLVPTLFLRPSVAKAAGPKLDRAFRWLTAYALAMVGVQFVVELLASALKAMPASEIQNYTQICWGEPCEQGEKPLIFVSDPHYLLLLVGLLGMALYCDPRLVRQVWESGTRLFKRLPWRKG